LVGFPTKETFLDAVCAGNYATWPGVTAALLNKYFPNSDEMQKGHMKGQRQGVRSTKHKALEHILAREQQIQIKPGIENSPTQIKRHDNIFIQIVDLANTIHSDQTGAFPLNLQCGNRYIMVIIHINANYIFCEPMKNKTEGEMVTTYQKIVNRIKMASLGLKHNQLDNNALATFKECIKADGMTHEWVPPRNHRRNLAERAIQRFKHHFITILSGVDNKFPLSLWCHLLSPAELTVNLLQQSNVAPKISAYAHVHGQHDYMRKPFAPLGCAVQAHVKPDARRRWDAHLEAGFNIETSMEHHRCFNVYITKTRATRISDTVFFKHQDITNPKVSPETMVIQPTQRLTSTLQGTISQDSEMAEALNKVSKLFTKIAAANAAGAKAKKQRNRLRTHPEARRATPLPRVLAEQNPRVEIPHPRVPNC
jgi:hypothetical protein